MSSGAIGDSPPGAAMTGVPVGCRTSASRAPPARTPRNTSTSVPGWITRVSIPMPAKRTLVSTASLRGNVVRAGVQPPPALPSKPITGRVTSTSGIRFQPPVSPRTRLCGSWAHPKNPAERAARAMNSSAKRPFSCMRAWPFSTAYDCELPTNSCTIPVTTTSPRASASSNSTSENPAAIERRGSTPDRGAVPGRAWRVAALAPICG
jgi:hypothetical protein